MPDGKGPVTTRRRLRVELSKLREQLDLPQKEVAERLDWSLSKLIRVENGSVTISVTDVRALLGVYQAPEDTIEDMVGLARISRERRWWSYYRDTLSPQYQEFIGFESEAVALRQFHPTLVPGLLQTETYIRAVTEGLILRPEPQANYEKLVQVRQRRQKEILYGGNPPEFIVIIDEGALWRTVGGAEEMRLQLQHLAEMQDHETLSIAILPFARGEHFGMNGAFHIMDFADDADDSVLYLENAKQGDVALREAEDVSLYRGKFDELLAMSLRDEDAVRFLQSVADRIG